MTTQANAHATWPAGMTAEKAELLVRIGDLEAYGKTGTPEHAQAVAELDKLTKDT